MDPHDIAIYTLRHHQAVALAPLLQRFLVRDEVAEADAITNSVVVSASAPNRARIKSLIERLETTLENQRDVVPIRPGMRTYALPLSAEETTAKHLAAGDHVDVLVTLADGASATEDPASVELRTMVLIADVEIRAVDHPPHGAAEGAHSVATLDLHPVECTTLQYAQHAGELKLAKRNAEDRVVRADPELASLACLGRNIVEIAQRAGEKRAHDARAEVELDG